MKLGNSPSASSALAALALTATAACTSHGSYIGAGPTKQSPGQPVAPYNPTSTTPANCDTPVALQTQAATYNVFHGVEGNAHQIALNGYAGMKKYDSDNYGTDKYGRPLQGHMAYMSTLAEPNKVGGNIVLNAQLYGAGQVHMGTEVSAHKDVNLGLAPFTNINFPGPHTTEQMVTLMQEAAGCATQVGITQVNQRAAIISCLQKGNHPNMLITNMPGVAHQDDGEDCTTGCLNFQVVNTNECSM